MELRNAKPILQLRKKKNGKNKLCKTLAEKFNSLGNTLEIGYIFCIPEIPKKILPALLYYYYYYYIFIIFIIIFLFLLVV